MRLHGSHDPSRNVSAAFAALPTTLSAAPTAAAVVAATTPVPTPAAAALAAAAPAAATPAVPSAASEADLDEGRRPRHHYGNPAYGCRDDEDEVPVGSGRACAPVMAVRTTGAALHNTTADDGRRRANASHDGRVVGDADGDADGDTGSVTPPSPLCRLGGTAPSANGCPTDAQVLRHSRAWPICLAKGVIKGERNPYANGHFHCLLVCPCEGGSGGAACAAASHTHCPHGARCERGELRNRGQGVCTYR